MLSKTPHFFCQNHNAQEVSVVIRPRVLPAPSTTLLGKSVLPSTNERSRVKTVERRCSFASKQGSKPTLNIMAIFANLLVVSFEYRLRCLPSCLTIAQFEGDNGSRQLVRKLFAFASCLCFLAFISLVPYPVRRRQLPLQSGILCSPSWKATELRSRNSRFLGGRPNWKAIWELEVFSWGPVGRRQGYNCDLGSRGFLWC